MNERALRGIPEDASHHPGTGEQVVGDEVLAIRDLAVEALYTVTMAEHADDDLVRGERLAQARRDVAEVVARVEDVAAALGVAIRGEDRPQPPARRGGHTHERDRDR